MTERFLPTEADGPITLPITTPVILLDAVDIEIQPCKVARTLRVERYANLAAAMRAAGEGPGSIARATHDGHGQVIRLPGYAVRRDDAAGTG
jgi:hypothetical protein